VVTSQQQPRVCGGLVTLCVPPRSTHHTRHHHHTNTHHTNTELRITIPTHAWVMVGHNNTSFWLLIHSYKRVACLSCSCLQRNPDHPWFTSCDQGLHPIQTRRYKPTQIRQITNCITTTTPTHRVTYLEHLRPYNQVLYPVCHVGTNGCPTTDGLKTEC